MYQSFREKVENSPFKNVYWFSRYLINTDEYGALGKRREKELLDVVTCLETLLVQEGYSREEKLSFLKTTLFNDLLGMHKPETKVYPLVENLVDRLDVSINSIEDVVAFCIAARMVVVPTTNAIDTVPSDDLEFCQHAVKGILDTLGETKVGQVIATWDRLGTTGCLDAERAVIVAEFKRFLDNLSDLQTEHTPFDDIVAQTAFVQEFERRLGQKRKSRGGGSLESVVQFLFDYYKFSSSSAPEHFDQDLEVDKWFKCKDGWSIGISCKRTLRERWKQLSNASRERLSHFKIKEVWHLITFDRDLSDDKIVRLGEQGQVFYLMDERPLYLRCSKHQGMKAYVRPLSTLIADIRTHIK